MAESREGARLLCDGTLFRGTDWATFHLFDHSTSLHAAFRTTFAFPKLFLNLDLNLDLNLQFEQMGGEAPSS
jgi:hypothetical protein